MKLPLLASCTGSEGSPLNSGLILSSMWVHLGKREHPRLAIVHSSLYNLPMKIRWMPERPQLYPFLEQNLPDVHGSLGVYVIWQFNSEAKHTPLGVEFKMGGGKNTCIYVGQGQIQKRLIAHQENTRITRHEVPGRCALFIAWAIVGSAHVDGVERFLSDTLKPLEGRRSPDVDPIAVNPPWPFSKR